MHQNELSKEYLIDHYINMGETRYEISANTGVSPIKIGSLLQKYGIRRRTVTRHGMCTHPLNIIWQGMKERCSNSKADNYKWYGERGIKVCSEWETFLGFYTWAIVNGWAPGLTLDRIDCSGDYCPENCRFVTHKAQCRNRKSNKYLTVGGKTMLQCEWEEYLCLPRKVIAKWKYHHGEEYVINKIKKLLELKGEEN